MYIYVNIIIFKIVQSERVKFILFIETTHPMSAIIVSLFR